MSIKMEHKNQIEIGILALEECLSNLNSGKILSDEEQKKSEKILDMVNRIINLNSGVVGKNSDLQNIVAKIIFGEKGDKKSVQKKMEHVEELLVDLQKTTIQNLLKKYVEGNPPGGSITLEKIIDLHGGIFSFNENSNFNGISPRDVRRIYRFDPKIPAGIQQRGKGESLFSLAFNAPKNPALGGDVLVPELNNRVMEIKSTINAGISPEGEAKVSPDFEKIVYEISNLFPCSTLAELKEGRIQKESSSNLRSKILLDIQKNGGKKSDKLFNLLISLVPKNDLGNPVISNLGVDDVLPLLLLFQLNYYSNSLKNFEVFCVFVERGNSPSSMVIIDSEGKNFISQKNLNTVRKAGLAPKITTKRVEIYMP